jgi:hypothetical protein
MTTDPKIPSSRPVGPDRTTWAGVRPPRPSGDTPTRACVSQSAASIRSLVVFLRRHAQAKRTEDALYSWQQMCDEQEMELAALRGALDQAQKVVDSFDRRPTEGCVSDVIGLAESLRRYREMRDGQRRPSVPRASQARVPSGL